MSLFIRGSVPIYSSSENPRRIREGCMLCEEIDSLCRSIWRSKNYPNIIRKEARDLNDRSKALVEHVMSKNEKIVKEEETES